MMVAGIIYGMFTGNVEKVSDGFLEGGREAVSLSITMLGIVSLWTGLMNIATKSGLIDSVKSKIGPLIRFLFPGVPTGSLAADYISMNLVANFFGLGWAATPAGLRAMEEMGKIQDEREGRHQEKASNAMCAFLIINISSIQLIPVNIIAYRAEYGGANPAEIILPGLIATTVSTLAGIVFCRIMFRVNKNL